MPKAIMSRSFLLVSSLLTPSSTTSLSSPAKPVMYSIRPATPCTISSCYRGIGVILSFCKPYGYSTVRERKTSGVMVIDDVSYKFTQT